MEVDQADCNLIRYVLHPQCGHPEFPTQGFKIFYNGLIMPKKKSTAEQANRVAQILERLEKAHPNAQCALRHSNPLELLVATILSAQCTDERVNIVTQDLFRKYRNPKDYAVVPPEVLEKDIRSTGFFRNKTKSIQGACRLILEKFGGSVPGTMEELLLLPGVARKTANVVLGVAFKKAEGIVVDTHVYRVSRRLDLTRSETPENIERDLMQSIPRNKWISFSHQMILHGRNTCKARNPMCPECPVESLCYSEDKVI
jgi:endonuclease III